MLQQNSAEFSGSSAQLRQIFSQNLCRLMQQHGKRVADLAADLSLPYTTVAGWAKGEKYPRIDKIEALAQYFGVTKPELIENAAAQPPQDVGVLFGDIVARVRAGESIMFNGYTLPDEDAQALAASIEAVDRMTAQMAKVREKQAIEERKRNGGT